MKHKNFYILTCIKRKEGNEMKFLRVIIYGFGKWTDTEIDFTTENAAAFYGANEAGKTTLQQFILYMLFGLAPKQRKHFRPKQRTEIGGVLYIHDTKQGYVAIQRKEGEVTCFLEDGTEEGEAWWSAYLSGLTKEMYTAIYSFSAQDLMDIQHMKQKELSDVLFSIGLTGSTVIYEVEKKLVAEKEKLFKKRGQKPLLNQQINKTDQLYKQLSVEQAKEATYYELKITKEEKEKELENLQNSIENLQWETQKQEKIKQNIADIHYLYQANKQYETFPGTLSFPEEGKERLEKIKQKNYPLQADKTLIQQKQADNYARIEQQTTTLLSEDIKQEAEKLLAEQSAYEHREYVVEDLQKKREDAQTKKQSILDDLNWADNEAETLSLPFQIKTRWANIQTNVEENNRHGKELAHKQIIHEDKQKKLADKREEIIKQQLDQTTVSNLRRQLNQASVDSDNEINHRWMTWSKQREKQSRYIWYGSLGMMVLTLALAVMSEDAIWYLFPVLFFTLGIGQRYWGKQQVEELMKAMESKEAENSLTKADREEAERQINQFDEQQAELKWIHQEENQLLIEINQRIEEQSLHETDAAQLEYMIQQERDTFSFLEHLELAHWLELLERIYKLQETEKQIEKLSKDIQYNQQQNAIIEETLKGYPVGSTFTEIANRLQEHTTALYSIREKEEEIKTLEEKRLYKQDQMNRLFDEKTALFEAALVEDEESFYEKANQIDAKESLNTTINNLTVKLQVVFPQEMLDYLLERRPQSVDVDQLIKQNNEDLKTKQTFIKKVQSEIAELNSSIDQLERKEDASLLAYQFQMEKDEMNQLGKKWSVVNLAHTALEKAKHSYQEKYMSEVIEWTTEYFSAITQHHYIYVYPPTEEQLFQVEAKSNIRYTVDELSQGTVDQLYVSLRLAIAKVMLHTYQVPLLIDDAFVHFDDARMKEALTILGEIAKEQQVLFFTCKQKVREALPILDMRIESWKEDIG